MESLDAELPEPDQFDNRLRTTLNIQFLHNIGNVVWNTSKGKKLYCPESQLQVFFHNH